MKKGLFPTPLELSIDRPDVWLVMMQELWTAKEQGNLGRTGYPSELDLAVAYHKYVESIKRLISSMSQGTQPQPAVEKPTSDRLYRDFLLRLERLSDETLFSLLLVAVKDSAHGSAVPSLSILSKSPVGENIRNISNGLLVKGMEKDSLYLKRFMSCLYHVSRPYSFPSIQVSE